MIAHRGDAKRRPENTLCAIRSALDAGAAYVEFDVQLTADGVPVVIHDHTLLRTAGIEGSIHDRTLTELAGIGVGEPDRFGERFKDEPIPTLEEVMELLAAWPAATAFVEMKRASIRRFGVEPFAGALSAVVEPLGDRCVVISYDAGAVEEIRRRRAGAIGWVIDTWTDDARSTAERLAPAYLFVERSLLPPEPEQLWSGPWQWVVYDIDDPDEALSLFGRGVAFIETWAIADLLADPRLHAGGVA